MKRVGQVLSSLEAVKDGALPNMSVIIHFALRMLFGDHIN